MLIIHCILSKIPTLKFLGFGGTADLLDHCASTHHLANVRYLQKEEEKEEKEKEIKIEEQGLNCV